MGASAARIELAAGTVVVEGALLDDACDEFERALEALKGSHAIWTTVDLSRVTSAASRPIELLFSTWLDLFREGRAPFLKAPDEVWHMLGKAAVDRGVMGGPAGGCRRRGGEPA